MTDITAVKWDDALIEKYNINGPRYTSYPTAVQFDTLTENLVTDVLERASQITTPMSLYVHLPFCERICFYCACMKVGTKDKSKSDVYLDAIETEAKKRAPYFKNRRVDQLHFGGGTPTFLTIPQMDRLITILQENFNWNENGEYSIEIDPRTSPNDMLTFLRSKGFNRISLGIQDFNEDTQKAVNRVQSLELVTNLMNHARSLKFDSISYDLIYGLPHQNEERFLDTLAKVLELSPDRLSVYNYAHLPERFKPQRRIITDTLPLLDEKLRMLKSTIETLQGAGYVYIGMDHFAKPDDGLAKALTDGSLQRNFQGYSTHGSLDLLGLGVSSISHIQGSFVQNDPILDSYQEKVMSGQFFTKRGVHLTEDDLIRQKLITQLACAGEVRFSDYEEEYQLNFKEYFAYGLEQMKLQEKDQLVELTDTSIKVLPQGRLLLRAICMAFDAYLEPGKETQKFSKVI